MPLPTLPGTDADFLARLKTLLPRGWFGGVTPLLDAIMTGFADMLAWVWSMLLYAQLQARIATATGNFLDGASLDYFGGALPRQINESDTAFRGRIAANFWAPRNTRAAIIQALVTLTGRTPTIIEPMNTGDTGGWDTPAFAWDAAGCWGDTNLPFQFFVIAHNKLGGGIATVAGWDGGPGGWDVGAIEWTDPSLVQGLVTATAIQNAILTAKPAATIAWMRIS